MARVITDLFLAKEVAAGLDDYVQSAALALNDTLEILEFEGSSVHGQNASVSLIWDYGGAAEEILWIVKGIGKAPAARIPEKTAAGGEVVALVLNNSLTGPVRMSGSARIVIRS